MGLSVLFKALSCYAIYLLLYLSDLYNVYIFDRMSQDMEALVGRSDLEFDYIISEWTWTLTPISLQLLTLPLIPVGGGTTGSLLATKMMDKNVLLLEAGAPVTFLPKLPILGPMWQASTHDWQYTTEPQEHACKAMNNRQSKWPRGKIFGGTHLLSNLIHMIGGDPDEYRCYVDPRAPFDYDTDIGQYFREYESLMHVKQVPFESELSRLIKSGASEIDLPRFHHPNVSLRNGLRFTTASLYSEHKEQQQHNGHDHTLLFNVMVNRLHLNSESQHVDTVEFVKGGVTYHARARKAVILSAGAIGSPAILLRSGIGPKEDLKALNIEPRLELPVGKYLMDHVSTGIDLVTLNSTAGIGVFDAISMENLYKFFVQQEGLISMPGCDLYATTKVLNSSQFDDLQFMVIPMALNSDHGIHLRKLLNFRDEVYYDYFHSTGGRESVTILPVLLKPKSVGVLRLRSNDPKDPPIIDPKYLSHTDDKKVFYGAIQLLKRLINTEALRSVGAQVKSQPFPGCEEQEFDSESYWMCYFEHVTLTCYHPAGTCRMGSCPEDSVVDYNFRVHGVDNLYVVDASVMPELPAANPIATINMLALRFLDRVLFRARGAG